MTPEGIPARWPHRLAIQVRLLKASAQAYTEVARFQASGKTYSHPAWHGGVLYVRDPLSLTAWPLVSKP